MGESSLACFCPLFGFLRRAPSSGEAELETTWTSRGLGKVTLATFSLPSQHLPWALLAFATDLPLLPVASSTPSCHTLSLSQVYSPGLDLGAPTVKQAAVPLPGSGSWEGADFGLGRSCISWPWSLKMGVSLQVCTRSSCTSASLFRTPSLSFFLCKMGMATRSSS